MQNFGKIYSKAELAEIRRRKAEGETYMQIAKSLDRSYGSMMVILGRDKKGTREGTRFQPEERYNEALGLLKRGFSIREIAKRQKRWPSEVCALFDSQGLTSEARKSIMASAKRWKWLKERTKAARTFKELVANRRHLR
ncbi:MAG: hypothetical protein RLZZ283_153 [Candidatus Parcubacteria bacterium]|jgi:hypothetical protein